MAYTQEAVVEAVLAARDDDPAAGMAWLRSGPAAATAAAEEGDDEAAEAEYTAMQRRLEVKDRVDEVSVTTGVIITGDVP